MLPVGSLPTRDKSQVMNAFIRTQQSHAKYYAEEGQKAISSWDERLELSAPIAPAKYETVGNLFDTPVLKPRTANPYPQGKSSTECPKAQHSINRNLAEKLEEAPGKASMKKKLDKSTSKTTKKEPTTKAICGEPDEDHIARLKERRERKRANREAGRSPLRDTTGTTKNSGSRSKAKSRIPAGLALMHGFSSTNVGKNRLTRKPAPLIGVFNKGKASAPAKVTQGQESRRKKDHGIALFSEAAFLKNNRKRSRMPLSDALSRSGSLSGVSESSGRTIKTSKAKKRRKEAPEVLPSSPASFEKISEHCGSESDNALSSVDASSPRSEKWDIENSDFVLPSRAPSPAAPTVVLEVQKPDWFPHASNPQRDKNHEAKMRRTSPTPSLRPSQSASQGPGKRFPENAVHSRFFPAANSPVPDIPLESPPYATPAEIQRIVEHETSQAPDDEPENLCSDDLVGHFPDDSANEFSVYDPTDAPKCYQPLNTVISTEMSYYNDAFPIIEYSSDVELDGTEFYYDGFGEAAECSSAEMSWIDDQRSQPLEPPEYLGYHDEGHYMDFDEQEIEYREYGEKEWPADEDTLGFVRDSLGQYTALSEPGDFAETQQDMCEGAHWDEDVVDGRECFFLEGRGLLLGLSPLLESRATGRPRPPTLSRAEDDVARSIRGHWFPQRL